MYENKRVRRRLLILRLVVRKIRYSLQNYPNARLKIFLSFSSYRPGIRKHRPLK